MGILGNVVAGAIGGGAAAAQEQAQGQLKDIRQLDVAQQLSAMEEQRQMRIMEAQETTRRAGREADVRQNIALQPEVTASEIEARKSIGAYQASPEVLAQTTAIAGAKPEKVAPGEQVIVNGKVVGENKRPSAGEASLAAYREGLKGVGSREPKVDHFEAKEWDKAFEGAKDDFKVMDPSVSDKPVDVPAARSFYRQRFNELRGLPGATPHQVAAQAADDAINILNAAKARVASPKGRQLNLTLDQSMQDILGEIRTRRAAAAAAAQKARSQPAPAQPGDRAGGILSTGAIKPEGQW